MPQDDRLAVFHALADAAQAPPPRALGPRPALTHISLYGIPYLDVIARAISRAAPHLTTLTIRDGFGAYEDVRGATPGLSSLLTACSSSLTSLNLKSRLCGFPLPLANALRACTRLTHITTKLSQDETYPTDAAPLFTRTVGAMSHLRSLNLHTDVLPTQDHHAVAAALGSLTQINRLKLVGFRHCGGSDLLGRVLHPLRHTLTSLHVDLKDVNGSTLQLLASDYTHLTRLTLESDELHLIKRPPQHECTANHGGGSGVVTHAPSVPHQPLPPSLQELRLRGNQPSHRDPRVLLALQLPPSLMQLTLMELQGCPAHAPKRHQAESAGGAAGSSRCGKHAAGAAAGQDSAGGGGQVPTPCPGFEELLAAVRLMYGRYDTSKYLDLEYNWHPWSCSWPAAGDGHVRLFGALRPLGLRRLALNKCVLQRGDVEALVDSLPQLEDLLIQADVHPRDVPLFCGLEKLRMFGLYLQLGRGTDAWCASRAVATALLPLARDLPAMRQLSVTASTRRQRAGYTRRGWGDRRAQRRRLRETMLAGDRELRQAMRGIGRDAGFVDVQVEELAELHGIHEDDMRPDTDTDRSEYDNMNVEMGDEDGPGAGGGEGGVAPMQEYDDYPVGGLLHLAMHMLADRHIYHEVSSEEYESDVGNESDVDSLDTEEKLAFQRYAAAKARVMGWWP